MVERLIGGMSRWKYAGRCQLWSAGHPAENERESIGGSNPPMPELPWRQLPAHSHGRHREWHTAGAVPRQIAPECNRNRRVPVWGSGRALRSACRRGNSSCRRHDHPPGMAWRQCPRQAFRNNLSLRNPSLLGYTASHMVVYPGTLMPYGNWVRYRPRWRTPASDRLEPRPSYRRVRRKADRGDRWPATLETKISPPGARQLWQAVAYFYYTRFRDFRIHRFRGVRGARGNLARPPPAAVLGQSPSTMSLKVIAGNAPRRPLLLFQSPLKRIIHRVRARRGVSGALYPEPAIPGLKTARGLSERWTAGRTSRC